MLSFPQEPPQKEGPPQEETVPKGEIKEGGQKWKHRQDPLKEEGVVEQGIQEGWQEASPPVTMGRMRTTTMTLSHTPMPLLGTGATGDDGKQGPPRCYRTSWSEEISPKPPTMRPPQRNTLLRSTNSMTPLRS